MNFKKIAFLFSIFVSQQVLALSVAIPIPPGAELLSAGKCEEFTQVFVIEDAKEPNRWDGLWLSYFNRLSTSKRIECLNIFEAVFRNRLLLIRLDIELIKAWYSQGGNLNQIRNSKETIASIAARNNDVEFLKWLKLNGSKPLEANDLANELTSSSLNMSITRSGYSHYNNEPQKLQIDAYDWLLENNYYWPTNPAAARALLFNLSKGYLKNDFKNVCEHYKKTDFLETVIEFEKDRLQQLNSSKFLEFDSLRKDSNTSASKFFVYKLKSCDLDTSLE